MTTHVELAADPVSGLAELVDAELTPVLRRLGARPRGAGDVAPAEEDAQARAAVWQVLADLGVLRLVEGRPGDATALVRIVELLGTALHQSPLPDTALAVDLLVTADPDRWTGWRDAVVAGKRTAAVAVRATGAAEPDRPGPAELAGGRITARRCFVPFAADVDDLVVLAADPGGRTVAAVVRRDRPGVRVRRHDDIARGDLYDLTLDGAVVEELVPVPGWPAALGRARLRQAAYLVGGCRGSLDLAAAYLRERRAFGAPLAKMQAPAYGLAALAARIAAVRAYVRSAVGANADLAGMPLAGGGDDRLAGAQALLLAAQLAREVTAQAVHLHGAYGLTERCEAQLFFRRAAVDSTLLGTVTGLRRVAAERLTARYRP